MPTYDYICEACNYEFESFQSMKEDPSPIAPVAVNQNCAVRLGWVLVSSSRVQAFTKQIIRKIIRER